MKYIKIITVAYLVLLLVGCMKVPTNNKYNCPPILNQSRTERLVYVDRNITVYKNQTTYLNGTECICEEVLCEENTTSGYSKAYVLNLIRQIRVCDKHTDNYGNSNETLADLNTCIDKLEDCENELCNEWNSSWC